MCVCVGGGGGGGGEIPILFYLTKKCTEIVATEINHTILILVVSEPEEREMRLMGDNLGHFR